VTWDGNGSSNGALLAAAAAEFDVVLTSDRNLKYQQNVSVLPVAVIVLVGKTNKLADMRRLVPAVEAALSSMKPGSLIEVSAP